MFKAILLLLLATVASAEWGDQPRLTADQDFKVVIIRQGRPPSVIAGAIPGLAPESKQRWGAMISISCDDKCQWQEDDELKVTLFWQRPDGVRYQRTQVTQWTKRFTAVEDRMELRLTALTIFWLEDETSTPLGASVEAYHVLSTKVQ